MRQKGFRVIIILASLLVTAFSILFIFKSRYVFKSPNVETDSKWKTFKNDLYEINYPSDFSIHWSLSDNSVVYLEGPQNISINIFSTNHFGITEPINNWAKRQGEEILDRKFLVDGNEAIITRKLTQYDWHSYYIVKRKDDSIYTFSVGVLNYDESKIDLVEKIILSIKFIK